VTRRELARVATLAAVVCLCAAPRCVGRSDAPLSERRVVVYYGNCPAAEVLLPAVNVGGVFVSRSEFLDLDPPFGSGDAIAFAEPDILAKAVACCAASGEIKDSGTVVALETEDCKAWVSGDAQRRRVFDRNGREFDHEEILEWELGRRPPAPMLIED
jgi:hypothetical protein